MRQLLGFEIEDMSFESDHVYGKRKRRDDV